MRRTLNDAFPHGSHLTGHMQGSFNNDDDVDYAGMMLILQHLMMMVKQMKLIRTLATKTVTIPFWTQIRSRLYDANDSS